MILWTALSLQVSVLVACFLILRREMMSLNLAVTQLGQAIASHQADLKTLENQSQSLLAWIDAEKKKSAGLWLGAFLPTDQSAADLEKQIRDSEDRAISATLPASYSPRDSRSSRSESLRTSIRPARNSARR